MFNRYFNGLLGIGGGKPLAGAADFSGTEYSGANALTGVYDFGYAITINSMGAFFFPSTMGVGVADRHASDMNGLIVGTASAQRFILLHELAHYYGASDYIQKDFNPDNPNDVRLQKKNNDLLWDKCGKTIKGSMI